MSTTAAVAALGRAGIIGTSGEPASVTVDVAVTGLPTGKSADIWELSIAADGGYRYQRELAHGSGNITIQAPLGTTVGAVPVVTGKQEGYMAADRFQRIESPQQRLLFHYRPEVHFTVSMWSTGPEPAGNSGGPVTGCVAGGSVSMQSQWVARGTEISITATPAPGYHFVHWGVFEVGERADRSRSTTTNPVLMQRVDRPIQVLAGFLGER